MEFFKVTRIGFMRHRNFAALFSIVIMLASLVVLSINGLNLGLDFTGGSKIDVNYQQSVDPGNVRSQLAAAGFDKVVVQAYDTHRLAIRLAVDGKQSQEKLNQSVLSALPGAVIQQSTFIGPQVGHQLMTNGVLAVVVAMLATIIYIALRFEYRFALSAAIALLHDPILVLGIFSAFHLEFNLIVLAAVLTVIGYSLNDTIVVYDRVRENFRLCRQSTPTEVMDRSINQTLSRTIMTSGLTLLVVIALLIFGGEYLFGFALTLAIGIIIGTYSSIYIAGSLAISFGLTRQSLISSVKRKTLD